MRYQVLVWTEKFDFLDLIYPNWVFPVENRNSERYYWILPIRISLGTKFQLKLTIWIFFNQNYPKMVFLLENKKS